MATSDSRNSQTYLVKKVLKCIETLKSLPADALPRMVYTSSEPTLESRCKLGQLHDRRYKNETTDVLTWSTLKPTLQELHPLRLVKDEQGNLPFPDYGLKKELLVGFLGTELELDCLELVLRRDWAMLYRAERAEIHEWVVDLEVALGQIKMERLR
jgi:hypothetical protein